eukprot:s1379_g17.t1
MYRLSGRGGAEVQPAKKQAFASYRNLTQQMRVSSCRVATTSVSLGIELRPGTEAVEQLAVSKAHTSFPSWSNMLESARVKPCFAHL